PVPLPLCLRSFSFFYAFLFKDPAPPEIYPLSLHDALPIFDEATFDAAQRMMRLNNINRRASMGERVLSGLLRCGLCGRSGNVKQDRKSTRLNSSHVKISYAVFCLKKKKPTKRNKKKSAITT